MDKDTKKATLSKMSADLLHSSTQLAALQGNLAMLSNGGANAAQLNEAATAVKTAEYDIAVKDGVISQWIQHFAAIEAKNKFNEMLNPQQDQQK